MLQDALFADHHDQYRLASRSVAWWAMTVRPDPHNKVWLNNEQIRINYIANNREAQVENDPITKVVLKAPTHARGEDLRSAWWALAAAPAAWEKIMPSIENLYIADSSVFPSCPSVGPGLTVIAMALRLADLATSSRTLRRQRGAVPWCDRNRPWWRPSPRQSPPSE